MNSRIAIRAIDYRGQSGFAVAGTDTLGRQISIFIHTRFGADAIKAAIKAGRDYNPALLGDTPFCTFNSGPRLTAGQWSKP